jgi:hypothetical protein
MSEYHATTTASLRWGRAVFAASVRQFQNGIGLATDKEARLGFCCNKHYTDWWTKNHPDEELRWRYELHDPAGFQSPSATLDAVEQQPAVQKQKPWWKRIFHRRNA